MCATGGGRDGQGMGYLGWSRVRDTRRRVVDGKPSGGLQVRPVKLAKTGQPRPRLSRNGKVQSRWKLDSRHRFCGCLHTSYRFFIGRHLK